MRGPSATRATLAVLAAAGVSSCTATVTVDAGVDLASTDFAMPPPPDLFGLDLARSLWSEESSGVPDTLYAIAGGAADDVYAVGAAGEIVHSAGDGTWVLQPVQTHATLRALWISGRKSDLWAVGEVGTILRSSGDGRWKTESLPNAATTGLNGLWASSAVDLYAVGNRLIGADPDSIFHSKGDGTWLPQMLPAKLDPLVSQLLSVWGSGPGDLYVVGSSGTILHSTGDGAWTIQPSGTTEELRVVWGSGPRDLYAGGAHGVVLHSAGDGKWSKVVVAGAGDTNGIFGVAASDVWLAGEGTRAGQSVCGLIRGPAWGPPEYPSDANCLAIWGSGPKDLYAVGGLGIILHRRR